MSKQAKLKNQPQLYCLNPFCKSRTSQPRTYNQKGLTMHLRYSPECSRFVNCQYAQKPPSLSWLSDVTMMRAHGFDNAQDSNLPTVSTRYAARSNPYFDLQTHIELLQQCSTSPKACNTSFASIPTHHMGDVEQDQDDDAIADAFTDDNVTDAPAMCSTAPVPNATTMDINEESKFISFSNDEKHMVDLLDILESMACPDDAVTKIIAWARKAFQQGFQFNPSVCSRKGILDNMYNALPNAKSLLPSVVNVPQRNLPNASSVDIPLFDFVPQLLSLLNDTELMRTSKLALNCNAPFDKYVSPNGCYGEANSGSVYSMWYDKLITDPAHDFLCPIILYIDRTHVDEGGRYTLEPVVFTSSIFNIETRRSHNAWRPLGYISKDYEAAIVSLADGKTQDARKKERTRVKKENYHRQIFLLLSGIRNVQQQKDSRLQNVQITINNTTCVKNIFCPILFVICDMSAADDLCLHKKLYDGPRPHRACNATFDELNDPLCDCVFHYAQTIECVTQDGSDELLASYQQYRADNAFTGLQIGHPDLGIYGATTLDTMHAIREGLLQKCRDVLLSDLPDSTKERLNQMGKDLVNQHKQTVLSDYPRISVLMTKGVTENARIKAHEYVGLTFVLVLLFQQTEGWNILQEHVKRGRSNKRHEERARDLLEVLECLLCFDEWTRQHSMWAINDDVAETQVQASIAQMIAMIETRLPRHTGNEWKLPKIHELFHIVGTVGMYGALSNYCTACPETNHIFFGKKTGRATQKRESTFVCKSAQRLADTMVFNMYQSIVASTIENDSKVAAKNPAVNCSTYTFNHKKCLTWNYRKDRPPQVIPNPSHFLAGFLDFVLQAFPPANASDIIWEIRGFTEHYNVHADRTFRSHPAYKGTSSWYDWLLIRNVPCADLIASSYNGAASIGSGAEDAIPCRLAGIVACPLVSNMDKDTTDHKYVVQSCTSRTYADSTLCQEWSFDPNAYTIVCPSQVIDSVLVIPVDVTTVAVVEPINNWKSLFT